jgi:hypothetical protein
MGFWVFKSAREKALADIAKRLGGLEHLVKEDYEDDALSLIGRRLERLERQFFPEPEQPTAAQMPAPNLEIWNKIPEQWRGPADGIAKTFFGIGIQEALSDPTGEKLKLLSEKAGPMISKLPGLTRYLPKELQALLSGQGPPPTSAPALPTGSGAFYEPPE